MSIRCGHCKSRHEKVTEVRDCFEYENQPQESCCFSCDGLIGWDLPAHPSGERRGCGGPGICRLDFPASFSA